MKRYDLINELIIKNNYLSYLEIGVHHGTCFNKVHCKEKIGVDPAGGTTYKMTSNQFFDQNDKLFDIIFIDGLHLSEQVYKDILNSLKFLKENGTIVVHDLNPPNEMAQKREKIQNCWAGDCWKAWVRLREERDDLEMKVFDMDVTGCGVINRGKQKKLIRQEPLEYRYLEENRKQWLNLIKSIHL